MMRARIAVAKLAMNTLRYFLPPALLAVAAPASAQYACTTNYCISSQSISFQTPPGWPAVEVETCCRTHWGALPGAIDWSNGAPIMICAGRPEYVTSFPNCGDPQNVSQAFPLDYERPTFAIGVAWPNAKDYRCESACKKDPLFGVIGFQSGPRHRGSTLASVILGSRGWDAGRGDDCKDPPRVF